MYNKNIKINDGCKSAILELDQVGISLPETKHFVA